MGNRLESKEFTETILRIDKDLYLGSHCIVRRTEDPEGEFVLKQQFTADSNLLIEEIVHRIGKSRPPSNIISVKDIIKRDHNSFCSQAIPVYLYYDYYPQTLRSEIRKRRQANKPFGDKEIWFAMNEISRGLARLKQMGISHWDVRPETVFRDQNDNMYIMDSSYFVNTQKLNCFLEEKMRNSLGNMSPQLMECVKKGGTNMSLTELGPSNDMFAFGLTILQMLTLRQSNDYHSSHKLHHQRIENDLRFAEKNHKEVTNFVTKTLHKQSQRLNIEEVRKQLRPKQTQIIRTLSFTDSDKPSTYQPIFQSRVLSYCSPAKIPHNKPVQFRSPQKISLSGLKKSSSDGASLKDKPDSRIRSLMMSPRAKRTNYNY